ncbi:MAG: hypothetical protein QXP07_00090 [Candidatus Parvarchaeum sp.]|nr:hypothetical protein [Candidatus Parvarchaeum tengchongense]
MGDKIKITMNWPWEINYVDTELSSSSIFFKTKTENAINISPSQKVVMKNLTIENIYTLFAKSIKIRTESSEGNSMEIPPGEYMINIEVYAENIKTAAMYPIQLTWTGHAFDIRTEEVNRGMDFRNDTEIKLRTEKYEDLINIRKSFLYKK